MAKKESIALLEQLKGSLTRPTSPPAAPEANMIADIANSVLPEQKPPEPPPAATPPANAVKISISLYHGDLDRLDEIKRHMAAMGIRNLSDSEALRLACRSVRLSDELRAVYESMALEDRRRKRTERK